MKKYVRGCNEFEEIETVEVVLNGKEENSQDFCQDFVQEFGFKL